MLKMGNEAGSHAHLKDKFAHQKMSKDAKANMELIQKRIMDRNNKYSTNLSKNKPHLIIDNLRSLEDIESQNLILPTSTISSACRQNLKSRKSSRNSRNRSSSNTNKQSQNLAIGKGNKNRKKNMPKLDCYKPPTKPEKPTIKDLSSSRSRSRKSGRTYK